MAAPWGIHLADRKAALKEQKGVVYLVNLLEGLKAGKRDTQMVAMKVSLKVGS